MPRNTSARPKLLLTPRNRTNGSGISRPFVGCADDSAKTEPFHLAAAPDAHAAHAVGILLRRAFLG
jgi:hypothetical protein